MSFAVLHVTKFAGSGSGGIGAHIDRKHTPKNADPARTELNREIIPPRSSSMKKDIDERIQEGYTSTRKIRTDAVRAVGVRSEERRVGRECRSRWSWDHYKQTHRAQER